MKSKNIFTKLNIGYLFIAPWLIGFLLFQLYPLVSSFIYSFNVYDLLSKPKFNGFDNYVRAFVRDQNFSKSLLVTFIYVFTAVPSKLIFALLVALILNINIRFINVFRTIYYIPSIMGASVAIAIVWRFLFIKEGIINGMLSAINIEGMDWIGTPATAMVSIISLTVWQFGSSMVLFLAGLKQIPIELYESAIVDGAGKIRRFFHITLPMLTPIIFFNLIMQITNAFQDFTAPLVITRGGPAKATYLYGLLLYDNAFKYFRMGYASALSWILFLIILTVTFTIFKSSNKWAHYQDGGKF